MATLVHALVVGSNDADHRLRVVPSVSSQATRALPSAAIARGTSPHVGPAWMRAGADQVTPPSSECAPQMPFRSAGGSLLSSWYQTASAWPASFIATATSCTSPRLSRTFVVPHDREAGV